MLIVLQGTSLQNCLALGDRSACGSPPSLPPVQWRSEYIGIHNTYKSRAFLGISSEYLIFCTHFSVNLSTSLSPSLFTLLRRHGLFLGRLYDHYIPPKPFVQRFNDR